MKLHRYQLALAASVAVCVLLAAALAYVLMLRSHSAAERRQQIRGPGGRTGAGNGGPGRVPEDAPGAIESALGPVQLSPQRLQEIGVTTADGGIQEM